MNFTKIVKTDLDSPCQELSNSGLGIFLVISIFRRSIFCVRLQGIQFSRSRKGHQDPRPDNVCIYVHMYSSQLWLLDYIIVSQCVSLPAEQPLRVPVHASCCRSRFSTGATSLCSWFRLAMTIVHTQSYVFA